MSNKVLCANCGKGEEEEAGINLKACAACKLVKYCSRDCQIAHRPQHKKACKKRAKELHDEKLFKQPPTLEEDCPICFLRMPLLGTGRTYMSCCGKMICRGCVHAFKSRATRKNYPLCPFCRVPCPSTNEEYVKRLQKRTELNDAKAIFNLGGSYCQGRFGLTQDHAKALKLFHRAAELGDAGANYSIGIAHQRGDFVEIDDKKARHYYELAAIGGYVTARHNLGCLEGNAGNIIRALKHWMIAAKDGDFASLQKVKRLYSEGHATEDDYTEALHSYEAYLDEVKSDQRDEAAAALDGYVYYGSIED